MENTNELSQRFTPEPEAEVATPPFLQKRIRKQKNHTPKVKPTLKRRAAKWLVLLT